LFIIPQIQKAARSRNDCRRSASVVPDREITDEVNGGRRERRERRERERYLGSS